MTYRDPQDRLHDQPFKPFRIRLVNSTVYDIREPWMIMVGERSAIVAMQTRRDDMGYDLVTRWRTVSIGHMIELEDVEARKNGKRK